MRDRVLEFTLENYFSIRPLEYGWTPTFSR